MVSQLSARLLGTFKIPPSTTGSVGSNNSANSTNSGFATATTSTTLPMTALLPDYINLSRKNSSKKNKNITPSESFSDGSYGSDSHNHKRRKIMTLEEQAYSAYSAKDDWARGGLPFPQVRTTAPRMLLAVSKGIDMSSVTLVTSSEPEKCAAAGFATSSDKKSLVDTPALGAEHSRVLLTSLALFKECQSYYSLSNRKNTVTPALASSEGSPSSTHPDVAAEKQHAKTASSTTSTRTSSMPARSMYAESSTSSMTDNSSNGDGNNNENNRGEGSPSSSSPEDDDEEDEADDPETVDAGSQPRFMNMGQALSVSNEPRLVVLSFSPFVVVHVNAAFTKLTRRPSVQVLGNPLHKLFEDPVMVAALQTSCRSFSLRTLNDQAITVRTLNSKSDGSGARCKVHVMPIGQDDSQNTHFSLELENLEVNVNRQPSGDEILRERSGAAFAATKSSSMGVMG